MADVVVRPASPSPSISLLEIKAEARLVLKSFLRHSLSIPPGERPGRIGGEYKDPNKYSASKKDKIKKDANGWDSLDEEISAAEEKKHGIKNVIKRRLRSRSSMIRRAKKDGSSDLTPNNTLEKQSQPGQSDKPSTNGTHSLPRKTEEEIFTPSSASEEEGDKKSGDKNKKKKKKLKISDLFKKVSFKREEPRPQRPASLPFKGATDVSQPEDHPVSPSHPPEFYDGVAETLDRIAQKHSVKKKSPVKPEPAPSTLKDNGKEAVVQQLVQILTSEGDAINEKINVNPFLRSTLTRLSYPSFAKLLDTYASQSEEPPAPAPAPAPVSPTLRRLAITMDVSRRVVTATGVQRLTGYAERYMESFAPWVRSHGGWGNIAQLDEVLECD
ncbi:cylicin-1-like [Sinocyclocheilus anshuiensis]|uniref:Cylicin-1-like n=1 Tax=Sinocyclocheilus anshuiensis TaxID=1608454 RepID=A0A671RFY6_9TELE|nr:PREDICTED: cylicin-1-like [Sinocyclocheilus anshuiensis]